MWDSKKDRHPRQKSIVTETCDYNLDTNTMLEVVDKDEFVKIKNQLNISFKL